MRLTKKLLRKLILEYLEQEQKLFGSWVEEIDKHTISSGNSVSDRNVWIEANIGRRLGGGAYRDAYELKDNSDFILKIAKKPPGETADEGFVMNKQEKELFNQYPDFFPKVYTASPEYKNGHEWIIIEKANVMQGASYDEYKFEGSGDAYKDYQIAGNNVGHLSRNFPHAIKYIIEIHKLIFGNDDYSQVFIMHAFQETINSLLLSSRRNPLYKKLSVLAVKAYNTDAKFQKLVNIIDDMDIAVGDIDVGNVGFRKDTGEFLIIDSSIWED